MRLAWVILMGGAALPHAARGTPIVYAVNRAVDAATVVGTITTDGTLGSWTSHHITSFSLTLSAPALLPLMISGSAPHIFVGDGAFVATATDLLFEFNLQTGLGEVGFSEGGGVWQFNGQSEFVGIESTFFYRFSSDGVQSMAHVIPEPSSACLLLAGLVALVAARSRAD